MNRTYVLDLYSVLNIWRERASMRVALAAAAVMALFAGSLLYLLYSREMSLRREAFFSNGRFLVDTYAPLSEKALGLEDDLTLVSYIQSVMEQKDVAYAMVLSPEGRILAHPVPSQIGRMASDPLAKRAQEAKEFKIFHGSLEAGREGYEFCRPLFSAGSSAGVFRVGILPRAMAEFRMEKMPVYFLILLVSVASAGLLVFFMTDRWFSAPLASATQALHALAAGDQDEMPAPRHPDEAGRLLDALGEAADRFRAVSREHQEENARLSLRQRELLFRILEMAHLEEGLVIADEGQKVVYVNEAGGRVIGTAPGDALGKHLLEATRNAAVLEAIKKSFQEPNHPVETTLPSGSVLQVHTVSHDKELAGTVLACGPAGKPK